MRETPDAKKIVFLHEFKERFIVPDGHFALEIISKAHATTTEITKLSKKVLQSVTTLTKEARWTNKLYTKGVRFNYSNTSLLCRIDSLITEINTCFKSDAMTPRRLFSFTSSRNISLYQMDTSPWRLLAKHTTAAEITKLSKKVLQSVTTLTKEARWTNKLYTKGVRFNYSDTSLLRCIDSLITEIDTRFKNDAMLEHVRCLRRITRN